MTATEFEDKLNDLVTEGLDAGLSYEDILVALAAVTDLTKDMEQGETG